jgi:hypothetical protein
MESLQHILSRICQCFFSSACIEELQIDSLALLNNLCHLFTLVSVNEAHSKRNNALLHDNLYQVCYEKGFLMAVSDAITSDDTKKLSSVPLSVNITATSWNQCIMLGT